FNRRHHRRLQNKIVHCDFGGIALFAGRFQFLARLHQGSGVDLDSEIKMRYRPETLDKTLGNSFTHSRKLNPCFAFACFDRGSCRFCRGRRFLWRGGFRFRRGTTIRFSHATVGPSSFDARKIDTELSRDPSRDRRCFGARFAFCRWWRPSRLLFLCRRDARGRSFLFFLSWRRFLSFRLGFLFLFLFGFRFLFRLFFFFVFFRFGFFGLFFLGLRLLFFFWRFFLFL